MQTDEFTTRALEEGRLDEAIRHLVSKDGPATDPRLLAQLLTQRGRFDEALTVVRRDVETRASSGPLSATDLRSRGNAEWRADRLADARDDLRAALARADDSVLTQQIRGELAVLDEEVESMKSVSRQLTRVDAATAVVGMLLGVALFVAGGGFRRHRGGT